MTTSNGVTRHDDEAKNMADWGFSDSICHCCGITNTEIGGYLMQCGRCKQAYYCSMKCFNNDLPRHSQMCMTGKVEREPTRRSTFMPKVITETASADKTPKQMSANRFGTKSCDTMSDTDSSDDLSTCASESTESSAEWDSKLKSDDDVSQDGSDDSTEESDDSQSTKQDLKDIENDDDDDESDEESEGSNDSETNETFEAVERSTGMIMLDDRANRPCDSYCLVGGQQQRDCVVLRKIPNASKGCGGKHEPVWAQAVLNTAPKGPLSPSSEAETLASRLKYVRNRLRQVSHDIEDGLETYEASKSSSHRWNRNEANIATWRSMTQMRDEANVISSQLMQAARACHKNESKVSCDQEIVEPDNTTFVTKPATFDLSSDKGLNLSVQSIRRRLDVVSREGKELLNMRAATQPGCSKSAESSRPEEVQLCQIPNACPKVGKTIPDWVKKTPLRTTSKGERIKRNGSIRIVKRTTSGKLNPLSNDLVGMSCALRQTGNGSRLKRNQSIRVKVSRETP